MRKCVTLSFRPAIHIPPHVMISWESTTCSQNSLLFIIIFFKMIPTNIQHAFLIYHNVCLSSFKWCRHYSKGCVQFTGHCKTFTTWNTTEFLALCTTVNETIPCHLSVTGYSVDLHPASWHKTVTSLIFIQKMPGSSLGQITEHFDWVGSSPQYLQENSTQCLKLSKKQFLPQFFLIIIHLIAVPFYTIYVWAINSIVK